MRLDFSNEEGYWDKVVNKPGGAKRKRSLEDLGGNHKRYLEEAWKEDYHGGLDRSELHKRWFGSDLVDWLKGLVNGITGAPLISHSIDEDLTVVLLREQFGPCNIKGAQVEAGLNVKCNVHAQVDTNFGLTIISTLTFPPDLSNSYLYFRNEGEITAKFTLDAIATASFSTGDIELFGLENFGATFSVPGILTVGPNFRIFGAVDGQVTLAGHLESQVNIAKWDVKQTYPDANKDYDPKATKEPDRDGSQILGKPSFNYSVSADGSLTAHVKPTITFGLDFNKKFLDVASAKVDLVADGWCRLHASATTDNGGSFCYGVDIGADLYASVEAPKAFGWDLSVPKYQLGQVSPKQVVPQTCPIGSRSLDDMSLTALEPRSWDQPMRNVELIPYDTQGWHGLRKRGEVYGPLLRLNTGLTCPGSSADSGKCPFCGNKNPQQKRADDDDGGVCVAEFPGQGLVACTGGSSSKRDLQSSSSRLVKRVIYRSKEIIFQAGIGSQILDVGQYPICSVNDIPSGINKWFTFSDDGCTAEVEKKSLGQINPSQFASMLILIHPVSYLLIIFLAEHVYEAQLLAKFFTWLRDGSKRPDGYSAASDEWVSGVLLGIPAPNYPPPFDAGKGRELFFHVSRCLGGRGNEGDLALLTNAINKRKGQFFRGDAVDYQDNTGGMTGETIAKNNIRAVSLLTYPLVDTGSEFHYGGSELELVTPI